LGFLGAFSIDMRNAFKFFFFNIEKTAFDEKNEKIKIVELEAELKEKFKRINEKKSTKKFVLK